MKKQILTALSFITINAISQVVPNVDWVRYYSERAQISNVPSAIDANSNVYITGYTYPTSANADITTIKYDAAGNIVWVKHYDNGGYDDANAITLDVSSNVYVTGESDGTGTGRDIITIKYDANGNQLWAKRFNGTGNGNDVANATVVDGSGNVYVTGRTTSTGGNINYVTIKYNSNGVQQWVSTFNGVGNASDISVAIDISSSGRLYITGTSQNTSANDDIVTIRLNPNNGNQMWSKTINGSANGNDASFDLLADGNDVVIVGSKNNTTTGDDYITLKYSGANGNILWQNSYDFANSSNKATAIVMDASGNYAVTGTALNGSVVEYHTLLFNSAGTQQWVNKVSTGLTYSNANPQIAVDPIANHFYVCGQKNENVSDIYVYQLTPTGNKSWEQTFNGAQNNQDAAVDLVVNSQGIVYVAGASLNSNAKFDYTTVRISQTPVYVPIDLHPDDILDPKYQFYKNQGQILNTDTKPASNVLFYTESCAPDLFIKNNSFSFVAAKIDSFISVPDTFQRIDMNFVGCNPYAKTFQEEKGLTSLNYFLPHCGANGITNIQGYNRLFTPNIYPNVDLHYCSNDLGLKLFFIVKPNADANAITLNINGASSATVMPNGKLKISTFKGDIIFNLEAYQVGLTLTPITLSGTPQIQSIGGNNFRLVAPVYNSALPLVLMLNQGVPAKVQHAVGLSEWSTPFGGVGYDEIMDVKTDLSGNSYWVGLTNSQLNFPSVSTGVSIAFAGGFDAFISVFGSAIDFVTYPSPALMPKGDALVSKTFYGGTGDDKAMGIAVTGNTANSEIFVTGFTNSADFNIATLTGAYNQSYAGSNDAFLLNLRYNALGLLGGTSNRYSTFIGGTGDDQANDIKISNGNLVIAGKTNSPASANTCVVPTDGGFPLCSPSFHSANSGMFDGFITTLGLTTGLVNSTFVGGDKDDEIKELAISSNNDVLFVGTTESDDATLNTVALATTGAYNQNVRGGLKDAMFGRYNLTSSANNWLSLFGGADDDFGNSIAIKQNNDFFISGYTKSSTPACSTSCYCQVPTTGQFPLCPKTGAATALTMDGSSACNDGIDGYFALFKETGAFDWGSYRGGDCGYGTETINSITYGGIADQAATGSTSFKNLTDGLFFGGATNSDFSSVNVSPGSGGFAALPSNMWYIQPQPNIISTHGYFGYYDSGLDFLHGTYFLNDYEDSQIPLNVFTGINKVHVFKNQLYFAGKTTSFHYARKSSHTTAGSGSSGNLHQSPYINSMTWGFNGPSAMPSGSTINYQPDAFMARTSIDGMVMYAIGVKEITKNLNSNELKLYPNPTTGDLTIEIGEYNHKNAVITVTNLLGQTVYNEKLNTVSGSVLKHQFNLSFITAGMYCISISNDNTLLTKTFIKQ